ARPTVLNRGGRGPFQHGVLLAGSGGRIPFRSGKSPFHGGNRGSNPLADANLSNNFRDPANAVCPGCVPATGSEGAMICRAKLARSEASAVDGPLPGSVRGEVPEGPRGRVQMLL